MYFRAPQRIASPSSWVRYAFYATITLIVVASISLGIYFGFRKPNGGSDNTQKPTTAPPAVADGTKSVTTGSGMGTGPGTGTGTGSGTGTRTGTHAQSGVASEEDIAAYGDQITTDQRVWIRSALGNFLCIVAPDTDRGPTLTVSASRGDTAAHWIIRRDDSVPTLFTISNATDAVGVTARVIGLPVDMVSRDGAELYMQRYPRTVFRFSDAEENMTYLRIHRDGSKFLTLDTDEDKIVQRNPTDADEMRWFIIPIRDQLVSLPALTSILDTSPSGQLFWITNAEGMRFNAGSTLAVDVAVQLTAERKEGTGRKFVLVPSEDEGFYFIRATTSSNSGSYNVYKMQFAIASSGPYFCMRDTVGADAQFWFSSAGNGYFYIRSRSLEICLDGIGSGYARQNTAAPSLLPSTMWKFEY